MARGHRVLAAILAALVLLAIFTPACAQALHRHHACSGEGCPVCALLAELADRGRRASRGILPWVLCTLLFAALTALYLRGTSITQMSPRSPIDQKVRMNS